MSAAAVRLVQIVQRQRELASEQAQLVEEASTLLALEGAPVAPRAPPPRDDLVDTAAAGVLTRRSSSWLYQTARKHPEIGWKLETGSWVWSRPALRAFMAGRAAQCEESEICEVCDAPGIPQTPKRAHIRVKAVTTTQGSR